jgi:membrane protein DedA with SNARE-associated domain
MQHVLELIRQHGDVFYLITFIWTALEGETFVIFAAIAAQRGLLNIGELFLAAWGGSMFGDQIFFLAGRYYGSRILRRFPTLQPKLAPVFQALEKYATGFILSYRFMYGVRNISGLAVGMSSLCWRRFALINAVAAFLWAMAFCGGGYLFGDVIERAAGTGEDEVGMQLHTFTLAILMAFVAIVGVRLWVAKRRRAKNSKD